MRGYEGEVTCVWESQDPGGIRLVMLYLDADEMVRKKVYVGLMDGLMLGARINRTVRLRTEVRCHV